MFILIPLKSNTADFFELFVNDVVIAQMYYAHSCTSDFNKGLHINPFITRSPPIGWARQNAVPQKFDSKPLEATFSALFEFR